MGQSSSRVTQAQQTQAQPSQTQAQPSQAQAQPSQAQAQPSQAQAQQTQAQPVLHPEHLFSESPSVVRAELTAAQQILTPEQFTTYVNTFYTYPVLPTEAIARRGMTPLGFKIFDGFIDDDQAAKDARFQIIQMYLQLPGIEVNYMMNVFLTKTLISSAILKQHECYIEDRIIELLLAHPNTDLITSSPISCALVGNSRYLIPRNPRHQHEYFPVEHDLYIVKAIVNACKSRGSEVLSSCVNAIGPYSQMSPLFTATEYVLFSQEENRPIDVAVYTEIVDILIENGARIRDGTQPDNLVKGEYVFTLPLMYGHPFAMSKEKFARVLSFVESRTTIIKKRQRIAIAESLPRELPNNIRQHISKFTVGGSKRRRKTVKRKKSTRG